MPWHVSRVEAPLVFFERTADAPPPLTDTAPAAAMRARPLREIGVKEAYALALERDSVESYSEFVAAYASDPLAKRARALLAARREALTWRRTRMVGRSSHSDACAGYGTQVSSAGVTCSSCVIARGLWLAR